MPRRENLKKAIMDHEGDGPTREVNGELRFFPYDDGDDTLDDVVGRENRLEGDCTIAWGFNLTRRGIGLQTAKKILDGIVDEIEKFLREEYNFWHTLSVARQNVLIEMVYHMGYGSFMQFKNMINALQDGDYERAAEEIKDSKAGKRFKDRYENLAKRMEEGVPYGR